MKKLRSRLIHKFENILSNLFLRAIIYIADGLVVAGSSLLVPIFAIFIEEIGGGIPEAGIAVAIYSLTAGLGIIFFSRIEDRIRDFRHFVVIGYFLAVVGYSIYLFTVSIEVLFIAQFVLGLATAVRVPAYDALLSQSAPGHIAVAWGNWYSMVFLVSAVNAFAGAMIADNFGFQVLILIILTFAFLAFISSLLLLKGQDNSNLISKTEMENIVQT
jgi:MFS family permease